jgi:PAS domain S-box-containing protein
LANRLTNKNWSEEQGVLLKNIFKINYLRNIFIVSLIITLTLPAIVIIYIYPSVITQLTKSSEDEAIRVARHLMFMIIPDKNELTKDSLSAESMNMIKKITEDFKLMKLKIFSKSGETIYSTTPKDIGVINKYRYFHDVVAKGKVYTKVVKKDTKSLEDQTVIADVVETYVPIMKSDAFVGAFEIYYDITVRIESLNKLMSTSFVTLFILAISLMGTIIFILIRAGKNMIRREQIEMTLRESEEKYRQLFEKGSDAVLVVDAETLQFEGVNKASLDLFGYSKEELLSLTVRDTSDEPEKTLNAIQKVKDEDPESKHIPLRHFIKKDGSFFFGEISSGVFVSGGRKKILSSIRDISERRRAEAALRESEKRFRTLFEFAPDAYYINDLEGNFIDGNRTAEDLLGYKREELVGKNFFELYLLPVEELQKATELLVKNMESKPTGPDEFTIKRKDGRQVAVEIRTIPIDIGGQDVVLGIARDASERKQAERERIQREKLQSVIEVAGAICHEMNQPMQAILGRSELLLMDISEDDAQYAYIKTIKEQIDRMGKITKKLMTLTKYETKDYLKGKIIDIDKASKKVE